MDHFSRSDRLEFWLNGSRPLTEFITVSVSLGNSMICSDIWHEYHEWYFEIVTCNFTSRYGRRVKFETILKCHKWYLCQISLQIMLLYVYTTTHTRFVIFTCRYFKLKWDTSALSQTNSRNFWCSGINTGMATAQSLAPVSFCWPHVALATKANCTPEQARCNHDGVANHAWSKRRTNEG